MFDKPTTRMSVVVNDSRGITATDSRLVSRMMREPYPESMPSEAVISTLEAAEGQLAHSMVTKPSSAPAAHQCDT